MAKFDSTKFSYELIHDTDCECPLQGDEHEVKIAYLERSRYTLGNEPVSEERMDEIAAGIRSGELIGVPVYAYVHGGVALRAGSSWHGLLPQGHAEFDSGQSGFVYISKADALKHWFVNAKRMSAKRLNNEIGRSGATDKIDLWGFDLNPNVVTSPLLTVNVVVVER